MFKRRNVLVVTFAFLIVFTFFRLTDAGSLTPDAAPAGTMHDLQEMYDVLVGTFDSSGVVASKQGDVMQVTKCITQKISGGAICP
jgi:hypothetical protein